MKDHDLRGEDNFVAFNVSRVHHPREVLGLARDLRVSRAEAIGFLVLWERIVLVSGDGLNGRVTGWRERDIAADLGWTRSPAILIKALTSAGVLKRHRTAFFHPFWLETRTGRYAQDKCEQRAHWREKKRKALLGDFPETSRGSLGDSPWKTDIKKERSLGEPPDPPQGGEGLRRWEWMRTHHDRPRDPSTCIKILDEMSEENWALCQWVLDTRPPSSSLKKRAFRADSVRFLRESLFLEFLPEWMEKLRREKMPVEEPRSRAERVSKLSADATEKAAAEEAAKQLADRGEFLRKALADPDVTREKRKQYEREWNEKFPGESLPRLGDELN